MVFLYQSCSKCTYQLLIQGRLIHDAQRTLEAGGPTIILREHPKTHNRMSQVLLRQHHIYQSQMFLVCGVTYKYRRHITNA
jgi:hypothetical protein